MRDIKFRVWDKINKEFLARVKYPIGNTYIWTYQFAINPEEGGQNTLEHCIDTPEGFDVMQFTGLLDKNGKEIYDGDIIITHVPEYKEKLFSGDYVGPDKDKVITLPAYTTKPVVVSMETPYAYYDILGKGKWEEVIGNIHENPELQNQ